MSQHAGVVTAATDPHAWMRMVQDGLPPLIVTCAVNGGVQGRESHPALPETPEQIAEACEQAYEAGASMVHIHGRDRDNLADGTGDPDVYREINALVRARCPDLIVNNTTGGGMTTTMEDRLRCLEAAPEMASLNMGPEMTEYRIAPRPAPLPHPHDGFEIDETIAFTYGIIRGLAAKMREHGVKPELEIYHPGQYWVTRNLIEHGLIEPPYVHQFVMGYQTSSFPTPHSILDLVRDMPAGSTFFVAGIGRFQLPMLAMSILLGGHVRVGLEDNLSVARGRRLADNADAVRRVVALGEQLNRRVATPTEARELLGLVTQPRAFAGAIAG